MNIIKRIFRISKAEAHSAIDSLEDPIKMTEQGIREMQDQLDKSMQALAQVKAMAIRRKNECNNYLLTAEDYQNKAILLIQKATSNELSIEESDRLAKEALKKKEQALSDANQAEQDKIKLEADVEKMQSNINVLKSNLIKWQNELKTLRARVQVSQATQDINKKMTQIDSNSTIFMLEKMKDKVLNQEALAEAYSDISDATKSVDEQINKIVNNADRKAEEELMKLKEQLNNNS